MDNDPSHGLQLPASFLGVLPCADCPGVKHHLDLWPDNVFHLHREWLERERRFDFSATEGCNRMMGRYERAGDALRFVGAASTRMARPPPLDAWEHALGGVLAQTLELYDQASESVATLKAVYLR